MHGQQFKLMIQNNTAGMAAYEHGKKGNQLLDDNKWSGYTPEENKATPNKGDKSPAENADKPGLHLTNSKPQFAMGDTPAYVTGLDDENPIAVTNADVSDPASDFWLTHERPEPFDPNDPNLADAPLKPGAEETDYTKYVADSGEKDAAGAGLVEDTSIFSKPQESETERLQRLTEGIRQANQNGTLDEYLEANGLDKSDMAAIPKQLEDAMGPLAYQAYVKGLEEENPIAITNPDVSDPTSDFWLTHVRPEPFDPNDPNLADAPLKPEYREDTAERNYAYGSAADDYADTGANNGVFGLLQRAARRVS